MRSASPKRLNIHAKCDRARLVSPVPHEPWAILCYIKIPKLVVLLEAIINQGVLLRATKLHGGTHVLLLPPQSEARQQRHPEYKHAVATTKEPVPDSVAGVFASLSQRYCNFPRKSEAPRELVVCRVHTMPMCPHLKSTTRYRDDCSSSESIRKTPPCYSRTLKQSRKIGVPKRCRQRLPNASCTLMIDHHSGLLAS